MSRLKGHFHSSVLTRQKVQSLLSGNPQKLAEKILDLTQAPSCRPYFDCIVRTHPETIILEALEDAHRFICIAQNEQERAYSFTSCLWRRAAEAGLRFS